MDKTHYERRSHEQGNYEITPSYGTSKGEKKPKDPDEEVIH